MAEGEIEPRECDSGSHTLNHLVGVLLEACTFTCLCMASSSPPVKNLI